MATEYFDGILLSDAIAEGAISVEMFVKKILKQLVDLLEFAHSRKISHTTINPYNILVNPQDGSIKVFDWGLSFQLLALYTSILPSGNTEMSKLGEFLAPEQHNILLKKNFSIINSNNNEKHIGYSTDIWQLAKLTQFFFENYKQSDISQEIMNRITQAIERGLEPTKEYRWQSISAFYDALINAFDNKGTDTTEEKTDVFVSTLPNYIRGNLLLAILLFPELEALDNFKSMLGLENSILSLMKRVAKNRDVGQFYDILRLLGIEPEMPKSKLRELLTNQYNKYHFLEELMLQAPFLPFHHAKSLIKKMISMGFYVPPYTFVELFNSGELRNVNKDAVARVTKKIIQYNPGLATILPQALLVKNMDILPDDILLSLSAAHIMQIYAVLKERYKDDIWSNLSGHIINFSTANNIILLALLEQKNFNAHLFLYHYINLIMENAKYPLSDVVSFVLKNSVDKIPSELAIELKGILPSSALFYLLITYNQLWISIVDVIDLIKADDSKLQTLINLIWKNAVHYELNDLQALYPLLKSKEQRKIIHDAAAKINALPQLLAYTKDAYSVLLSDKLSADDKLKITKNSHQVLIKKAPSLFLSIWNSARDPNIVDPNLISTLYATLKNSEDKHKCIYLALRLGHLKELIEETGDWETLLMLNLSPEIKLKNTLKFHKKIIKQEPRIFLTLWMDVVKRSVDSQDIVDVRILPHLYRALKSQEDKLTCMELAMKLGYLRNLVEETGDWKTLFTLDLRPEEKLEVTKKLHEQIIKQDPRMFLDLWMSAIDEVPERQSLVDPNLLLSIYNSLKQDKEYKDKVLSLVSKLNQLKTIVKETGDWRDILDSDVINPLEKLRIVSQFYDEVVENYPPRELEKLVLEAIEKGTNKVELTELFNKILQLDYRMLFRIVVQTETEKTSIFSNALLFELYKRLEKFPWRTTILKYLVVNYPDFVEAKLEAGKIRFRDYVTAGFRLGRDICESIQRISSDELINDQILLYITTKKCPDAVINIIDKLSFSNLAFVARIAEQSIRKQIFRNLIQSGDYIYLTSLVYFGRYKKELDSALSEDFIRELERQNNPVQMDALITLLILWKKANRLSLETLKALAVKYPEIISNIDYLTEEVRVPAAVMLFLESNGTRQDLRSYIKRILDSNPDLLKPFLHDIFEKDLGLAWEGLYYGAYISSTALYVLYKHVDGKTLIKRLKKGGKNLPIPFIDDVIDAMKKKMDVNEAFAQLEIQILEKFNKASNTNKSKIQLSQESIATLKHFLENKKRTPLHLFSELRKTQTYNLLSQKNKQKVSEVVITLSQLRDAVIRREIQAAVYAYSMDIVLSQGIFNQLLTDLAKNENVLDKSQLAKTVAKAVGAVFNGSGREIEALRVLTQLLKNPDSDVKIAAAEAVGAVFNGSGREIEALRVLTQLLKDSNLEVRKAAVRAIGAVFNSTGSKEALKVLTQLLKDSNEYIKEHATMAIVAMFNNSGHESEALNVLTSLLKNSNSTTKEAAVRAIGAVFNGTGSKETLGVLSPLLEDSNWEVREAAVRAIGAVFNSTGSKEALKMLTPLLKDSNLEVRKATVRAIGNVFNDSDREQEALRVLISLLKDSSEYIRGTAATVIGAVFSGSGNIDVLRMLIPFLKGTEWYIRDCTAKAIGMIFNGSGREAEVLRVLTPLLKDSNAKVRESAIRAIGAVLRGSGHELEALNVLTPLLKDSNLEVRKATVNAIGAVFRGSGSTEVLNILKSLFVDSDTGVRVVAAKAIGAIFKGSGREREALKRLKRMLKDSSRSIRRTAIRAIMEIEM
ncbi:MAG: HEAT repeat domain-containing protein [Candidatus Odinarchaeota archaeon]|nr:HEAT repeat domain-containing protein [Candidatus Odinarchaeota archaeon]